MSSLFDLEVDRKDSYSTKWQYFMEPSKKYIQSNIPTGTKEDQAIPMWVADMDYLCAEPIREAVEKMARHGIYGYSRDTGTYAAAICDWFLKRHDWQIDPESIVKTQGIIPALNMAVQTFVEPGQKVLLNGPVYYPFYSAIRFQGTEIVASSLIQKNGRYELDFDDLEQKLADPELKLALFCNPHNPGGMVWSASDISRYAELCLKYEVLLLSDEVHGDLVFENHKYTPLLTLDERYQKIAIVCTSPSKAFNMAGLQCSNIIIPNEQNRTEFMQRTFTNGFTGLNPFALTATEAAYNLGGDWLDQCVEYLETNLKFALAYIDQYIPHIKPMRPEATYLLWLDCSALEKNSDELHTLFNRTAKVYLDDGIVFGEEGASFVRMNFACTRNTLEIALSRIKKSVDALSA